METANLRFPAFENKKYTAYENSPYGKIPTKIEETVRKFRFSVKQSFFSSRNPRAWAGIHIDPTLGQ